MTPFSDVKKEFSDEIKGDFENFVGAAFDANNDALFVAAVAQGYADAKRTFSNISEFWDEEMRKTFFAHVAGMVQSACKSPSQNWHEDICDAICQWFKQNGYKKSVTYGQAQKIVNMAFKYLYCLPGDEDCAVFGQCHMPLDSFTLAWYRRYVMTDVEDAPRITEEDKWSNLNKKTYQDVAETIRQYLSDSPKFDYRGETIKLPNNPLDAEFYIWPEMQMHLAAETFYFSIKKEKEKKDWKKKSVSDKLSDIEERIKQYRKEIGV